MKQFLAVCFILSQLAASAQLTSTKLPIFFIDTQGSTIVDEPKITATLRVAYKGSGQTNLPTDSANYLKTFIGIEYRGSSSQSFPKKSYGFETRDVKGEDLKVSFFGWPKETDFILYASYNEKSLIHNTLTMQMAREMGLYASRTQYVQLFVNGSYEGIYVLMEKIKRDKDRVNIDKLEATEEAGDDLTGGYIIKIDKNTGSNYGSWFSPYPPPQNASRKVEFFYDYPDKTITEKQRNYIKNYVTSFEDALKSPAFADTAKGYRKYINTESFIKFFLVNEISRNVDGYRISTFLHKDKDSKGGKLTAGPPWDYDISYGNADYCEGQRFDRFAYKFNEICPNDTWLVPFWWERLLQDPRYVAEMRQTYDSLRQKGVLSTDRLMALIDTNYQTLKNEQQANFQRWPIIGKYVWPSPQPIPSSWDGEVQELRQWLGSRLLWLDANLPKPVVLLDNKTLPEATFQVFPNPTSDEVQLTYPTISQAVNATIRLVSSSGEVLSETTHPLTAASSKLTFKLPTSPQGVQFIELQIGSNRYLKRISR